MRSSTPLAPLTPLEIASGIVNDAPGPGASAHPLPASSGDPRRVLESLIKTALSQPPCGIAFSGGRDSSALLAIAVEVARREGLPLPIPITLRFPDVEATDESEWQELVVEHLGLEDWIRLLMTDELDLIGPYASPLLLSHGLGFPMNRHFVGPLAEQVRGGVLLTGFGGDEMLSPSSWSREVEVLRLRRRPGRTELRRLPLVLMPPRIRQRVYRKKAPLPLLWLQPEARRQVLATWRDKQAAEPVRWNRWVSDHWWPSRTRQLALEALDLVGAFHGAEIVSPLVDGRFLASAAQHWGPFGLSSRDDAMAQLTCDTLPRAAVKRQDKASFDGAFWSTSTRAFIESWDGEGIDPEIIDRTALERFWRSDPPAMTFLLLQDVWLRTNSPSLS